MRLIHLKITADSALGYIVTCITRVTSGDPSSELCVDGTTNSSEVPAMMANRATCRTIFAPHPTAIVCSCHKQASPPLYLVRPLWCGVMRLFNLPRLTSLVGEGRSVGPLSSQNTLRKLVAVEAPPPDFAYMLVDIFWIARAEEGAIHVRWIKSSRSRFFLPCRGNRHVVFRRKMCRVQCARHGAAGFVCRRPLARHPV